MTSTSGNLLNGNTASFIAYILIFFEIRLNSDSFSPAITLEAMLATGIPIALDTKGTVLLALGFTSKTYISLFLTAN